MTDLGQPDAETIEAGLASHEGAWGAGTRVLSALDLSPGLGQAPWLEREGHGAYTHHIPAGHDNLDALAHDPQLKPLFTREQVHAPHTCLDAAAELSSRATESATLVHGDLTPRNAGLDRDNASSSSTGSTSTSVPWAST
jgi:hypothetical protein